jgi:hypothetical protein
MLGGGAVLFAMSGEGLRLSTRSVHPIHRRGPRFPVARYGIARKIL